MTGVVYDVVQSGKALCQKSGEKFDTRCVPQIDAVYMKAGPKRFKIRFARIPLCGIYRKRVTTTT